MSVKQQLLLNTSAAVLVPAAYHTAWLKCRRCQLVTEALKWFDVLVSSRNIQSQTQTSNCHRCTRDHTEANRDTQPVNNPAGTASTLKEIKRGQSYSKDASSYRRHTGLTMCYTLLCAANLAGKMLPTCHAHAHASDRCVTSAYAVACINASVIMDFD